jgi:hypothetical protein
MRDEVPCDDLWPSRDDLAYLGVKGWATSLGVCNSTGTFVYLCHSENQLDLCRHEPSCQMTVCHPRCISYFVDGASMKLQAAGFPKRGKYDR